MTGMLSINNLPFKDGVFHSFGGSKERRLLCKVCDTSEATFDQADCLLDQLAGLDNIKSHLKNLESPHIELFRAAVRIALSRGEKDSDATDATPVRPNILLLGPTGVGKTTAAEVAGIYLTVNQIAKQRKVVLVKALDLRGEFIGETNVVVNKIMEFVRGGVLIIDEVDAISSMRSNTSFDKEARDQLNAVIEGENKAGTIILMTGYPRGIECLLNDQPGLRERFPVVFNIDKLDSTQALDVFIKKIESEGLRVSSNVRDFAARELGQARDYLGEKFGNGRTIERFVTMLITEHAALFPNEILENIVQGDSAAAPALLTIDNISAVPRFDKGTANFVRGGARLRLVPVGDKTAPVG